MLCPLCNNAGNQIRRLSKDFIKDELCAYYNEDTSINLSGIDYQLLKCQNCDLEYCVPIQSGGDEFYKWITKHPSYYPDDRWEWHTFIEQFGRTVFSSKDVLEIGCGSGKFLELLRQIPSFNTIGIDTAVTSVEECQRKGLEVYCNSIEQFSQKREHRSRYDYIVSFHCLEHVGDPKGFVRTMLLLLKPGGEIFLSTPYSPMSFEGIWFDPLNNPPHHLTRWNYRAYNELASQLDLRINFIMPKASGVLDRTLYALNLSWHGPATLVSRKKMLLSALAHPCDTAGEYMRQMRREKIEGETAADVVLVELSRRG